MPEIAYPFGPVPATVARWARMARLFAPSAVVGPAGNNPYGATINGLTLTIGRGTAGVAEAWVGAFFHVLDAADWSVAVPANGNATQARIDRVVLRLDVAAETLRLVHVQGTPAASPVPPTLQRDPAGQWDLPLWRFTVPANNGAPLSGLTDERSWYDPTVGGATTERVKTVDYVRAVASGDDIRVARLDPELLFADVGAGTYKAEGVVFITHSAATQSISASIAGTATFQQRTSGLNFAQTTAGQMQAVTFSGTLVVTAAGTIGIQFSTNSNTAGYVLTMHAMSRFTLTRIAT
jgi:hypothetical protein